MSKLIEEENSKANFYKQLKKPGAFMSAPYNQQILGSYLSKVDIKNDKPYILDAGSGLGFNLSTIFNTWQDAKVTAIDSCTEALEISRLSFNRNNIVSNKDLLKKRYGLSDEHIKNLLHSREFGFSNKQIEYIVADIENYTNKNHKFDIIIFTEVLEHVVKPHNALCTLENLLNEGGHMIVSTPNYYYNTVALIKKIQDKRKGYKCWSPWQVHEDGIENNTNCVMIEKIVKELGLTIVKTEAANYILALFPNAMKIGNKWPLIWIGKFFPFLKRFAMTYFVFLQKKSALFNEKN
jgi:2-polyprenyl-3-methyl-5-hydroxy-6-metoxy-1,4-benzoquinol methylase